MLYFPPGHEPTHVLRPSGVIPALRDVVAPLAEAIREHLAYAHLDGDPRYAEVRYGQLFHVEHQMTLARQLLESWRGARLTGEFGLKPRVQLAVQKADEIFLTDEPVRATQETLTSLESILADLGTWTGPDPQSKKPQRKRGPRKHSTEARVRLYLSEAKKCQTVSILAEDIARECKCPKKTVQNFFTPRGRLGSLIAEVRRIREAKHWPPAGTVPSTPYEHRR